MSHRYRYNTPAYYNYNPSGSSRNPRVINRTPRPITPPKPKTVYPTEEQIEQKLEYEGKAIVPILNKISTYIDSFVSSKYISPGNFEDTLHLFQNCLKYAGEKITLGPDKILAFFNNHAKTFGQVELRKTFWWRPLLNNEFETKPIELQFEDTEWHVGHYYMILDDALPYITMTTTTDPVEENLYEVKSVEITPRQFNFMLGTQYYIEDEGGSNVPALPDGSQGPHVNMLFQPYLRSDHELKSQMRAYPTPSPPTTYFQYNEWSWVEVPMNILSNYTQNFFIGSI